MKDMTSMNDTFYIIGGGPSFLDVTEDEWKFLENKNTIQFARVPYGSRKPKYYLSIEHVEADKSVLSYMAKLRWFDVRLLLYNYESLKYAKKLGFKYIKKINKGNFYFMPSRRPWFVDDDPPCSYYTTRAKSFRQPLFRFRGQLNAVVNACLILGAKEIRLIGIDMNDQYNFYVRDDYKHLNELCKDEYTIQEFKEYMNSKYATERLKSKNQFNPNWNPEKMHTTNMPYCEYDKYGDKKMVGMEDLLSWEDDEIRKEGMRGIFTTSKNSILYKHNKLEYRGIRDGTCEE